jgi:hypothetical protein
LLLLLLVWLLLLLPLLVFLLLPLLGVCGWRSRSVFCPKALRGVTSRPARQQPAKHPAHKEWFAHFYQSCGGGAQTPAFISQIFGGSQTAVVITTK